MIDWKKIQLLTLMAGCDCVRQCLEMVEQTKIPPIDYGSPIDSFKMKQELNERLDSLRNSHLGNRHSRRWNIAKKRRNNK